MTSLDTFLDRFVARLRARLATGAETYGDRSYTRPVVELVDEFQHDIEDVCGWLRLLWIRLHRIRGLGQLINQGGTDGHA